MRHILKCKKCYKYCLSDCSCGGETIDTKPPKYSPEDKYGSYRRKVKEQEWKRLGLIQ